MGVTWLLSAFTATCRSWRNRSRKKKASRRRPCWTRERWFRFNTRGATTTRTMKKVGAAEFEAKEVAGSVCSSTGVNAVCMKWRLSAMADGNVHVFNHGQRPMLLVLHIGAGQEG